MDYQIAIVDDMAVDTQYLHKLVEKWCEGKPWQVHIDTYSSAEQFLFAYEDNRAVDILLLDIEMDKMDGVTLAKKIRQDNETIQIIFVTGYADYILEGYDVAALHYLMKPIRPEKLEEVLDRAIEKIGRDAKILCFETDGQMIRLPIYEIWYAEVFRNYVTIHANENITIKMTLTELADELDERFFRISRSVLVNLTKVARVRRQEVILSNGEHIPIPRGAYEKINRAIILNL